MKEDYYWIYGPMAVGKSYLAHKIAEASAHKVIPGPDKRYDSVRNPSPEALEGAIRESVVLLVDDLKIQHKECFGHELLVAKENGVAPESLIVVSEWYAESSSWIRRHFRILEYKG